MSQRTREWISWKTKSLRESTVLPFHEILNAQMVEAALASCGVTFRERVYTPLVTLSLFLTQAIDPDHSCRAAVARLIVWLSVNGRKPCAAETNSYCDARQRLPLQVIVRLVRETAQEIDRSSPESWMWKGRRVAMVDGTTVSMPDTEANQKVYPQSRAQGIGLGFPLARIVVIISLASGVARDLAMGPSRGKETGETALFRALMNGLEAGEIVLGDRSFGSFFGIASLRERGVDGLFRMHQARKFDFRHGQRLKVEDHVVTWTKPARPKWMNESTYVQFPETLAVRELRFKVRQPGFRVGDVVLVTTMLDDQEYTKEELADLFLQRWNIALDIRQHARNNLPARHEYRCFLGVAGTSAGSLFRAGCLRAIKDVVQMDVLRCMTPEMVEKEVWIHLLAYNLIRGVMAKSAQAHELPPRELSFKGALQTMTAFQDMLRVASPQPRATLWEQLLNAIAQHRVGDRFGRVEPRANKRRPKKQRYLNEPRAVARKRLRVAA